MKTITQKEANNIVNQIFIAFQRWRSIEMESDNVGLFDNPMAEKLFKALLKISQSNMNIEKMTLHNLSYMSCVLYPAIDIILFAETEISLKEFLNLREFEILGEIL